MKEKDIWRGRKSERGIALFLSLFALILISAVGISLIYMAGTESNIAGNYRVSTMSLLAAQGGLEEGRERLMPASPDTIVPCPDPTGPCGSDAQRLAALAGNLQGFFNFDPASFAGLPAGSRVLYIRNPAPGENVNPTNVAATNPTRDTQYRFQFGANPPLISIADNLTSTFGSPNTNSAVSYKWIRMTMKTEQAVNTDYNGDAAAGDNRLPVFFDANAGRQRFPCCNTALNPSCQDYTVATAPCFAKGVGQPGRDELVMERDYLAQVSSPDPAGFGKGVAGVPVYQITALAVTPTGARRMVQYEVARMATINAAGAVVSEAPVTTNGNFQVFGSYPPTVSKTCRYRGSASCSGGPGCVSGTYNLCSSVDISSGKLTDPSCPAIKPPQPPQCCGANPCKDYCNVAPPVDGIQSGGSITINGSNSVVPDTTGGCQTNQTCVFTTSPEKGADAGAVIPYDIPQMVSNFVPPIGTPIEGFPGISCTPNATGGQDCNGNGMQFGSLPTTWPPQPGTQPPYPGNQQVIVYADGNVKLTAHSNGSGILVVDGDLDIGSGFEWFGLIIVKGVVTFSGGGGATAPTNIIGSVIAGQNLVNNNTTLGGGVNIIYDACAYKDSSRSEAYRVLSFRELLETAR